MMDTKWIATTAAVILLVCSNVDCRLQKPLHETASGSPSCTYNNTLNQIKCSYLQSTDMDLLKQELQETAQFVTSFQVYIYECDGPSIPADIFSGYNLSTLTLDTNNYTDIPYELLSNIQSPLRELSMYFDTYSSTETTATELFLPFSAYLTNFLLGFTNMHKITLSTFMQYSSLNEINMAANSFDSIGLELLQLYNLDTIDFQNNVISAIETGAFRDLKKLLRVYLNGNNLSELQDGAFMGLETSPIFYMGLDGNPFNCDCNLQWLKDWLNARNLTESSGARCAYPTDVAFNDIEFCPTIINN